jgi:hypothetical protein
VVSAVAGHAGVPTGVADAGFVGQAVDVTITGARAAVFQFGERGLDPGGNATVSVDAEVGRFEGVNHEAPGARLALVGVRWLAVIRIHHVSPFIITESGAMRDYRFETGRNSVTFISALSRSLFYFPRFPK